MQLTIELEIRVFNYDSSNRIKLPSSQSFILSPSISGTDDNDDDDYSRR